MPLLVPDTAANAAAAAAAVGPGYQMQMDNTIRLLTLRVGSFIAAPPYFTTMVLPAKRCMYGNASAKIDTRSRLLSAATPSAACAKKM